MNQLFTVLFLVFIGVTVAHFIYEAIALPSMRAVHRFKLFALRDRLRRLKIERGDEIADAAFDALDQSLSWQLENQHRVSLTMISTSRQRYEHDLGFKKEVDARLELLKSCRAPEFVAIHNEAAGHFMVTVGLNAGMALIYLFPLIWVCIRMKQILLTINQLVALPDSKLDALAPQFA